MRDYIHIGYPKTATSTLQAQYFPAAPSIHFLPEVEAAARSDIERLSIAALFDLLHKDGIDYDAQTVGAAIAQFKQQADPAIHKAVLFTQERFAAPAAANWRGDRLVIADRLKDLFPQGRIIVGLRNQFTMLHSQYVNRNAKSLQYRELGDWLSDVFDDPQRGYANQFRYGGLLKAYRDRFGAENVHIMLFEEFVQERTAFFDDLAAFMEIPAAEFHQSGTVNRDANPTKSARSLAYARLRNKLLPNVELSAFVPNFVGDAVRSYVRGGARARVEFPAEAKARIAHYYADSNAQVAGFIGEDRLRRFGYPLPGNV